MGHPDLVRSARSLWPSYGLLAVVFGALPLRSGPAVVVFAIAFAWLLWTLVVGLHRDLARTWDLAGPARWSCNRPLLAGTAAGATVFALVAVAGGVVWRAAVGGVAYGSLLGASGLLIRRRIGFEGD